MNKQDLVPLITIEECAEVQQAITKVFRFGINTKHCDTGITNKLQLETEIGQLQYMLYRLTKQWQLDEEVIMNANKAKQESMSKWYNYFPEETNG